MKLTKFNNQTRRVWKNSFDAEALPCPSRPVQYRGCDKRYFHQVRSQPPKAASSLPLPPPLPLPRPHSVTQLRLIKNPSIREDAEFLTRHSALPPDRIVAIETGGCPHAAVREDISTNLHALQALHASFDTDLLLIESGGDNLAANYSRELADFIVYVIDVAGGDKVPRKGGPGITGGDLLVVNKVR